MKRSDHKVDKNDGGMKKQGLNNVLGGIKFDHFKIRLNRNPRQTEHKLNYTKLKDELLLEFL